MATDTFAERLKRLRELRGFTQRGLGERAGLSASHVQALEAGRLTDPTLSTLLGLSRALGVSVGELAGETAAEPITIDGIREAIREELGDRERKSTIRPVPQTPSRLPPASKKPRK